MNYEDEGLGDCEVGEGVCPACGRTGKVEEGCPTCPGFWFTNEAVTDDMEDGK